MGDLNTCCLFEMLSCYVIQFLPICWFSVWIGLDNNIRGSIGSSNTLLSYGGKKSFLLHKVCLVCMDVSLNPSSSINFGQFPLHHLADLLRVTGDDNFIPRCFIDKAQHSPNRSRLLMDVVRQLTVNQATYGLTATVLIGYNISLCNVSG